jgi:putative ATP-binding cassette transporter
MRLQLSWRLWMMSKLVRHWVASALSRDILMVSLIDNPEARIAEDGRIAIELLVEMGGGIIYTLLISSSFIVVLWDIGGYVTIFGLPVYGYLVYSVLIYTCLTSISMLLLCLPLVKNVEEKAAAEGDFRYFLTKNIDNLTFEVSAQTEHERVLDGFFELLLIKWLKVIRGQTKIISFATTNNLVAPIIPVVLCAPKYLSGEMSLGDIMQTAAAFLQVQTSLNWLADNAFSLANWSASAKRVAALDVILCRFKEDDETDPYEVV